MLSLKTRAGGICFPPALFSSKEFRAMQFVRPKPFQEAVRNLGSKSVIGSQLKSSEWQEIPLALRERAFFSATIESLRWLQGAKDFVGDFLEGNRDPETGALNA